MTPTTRTPDFEVAFRPGVRVHDDGGSFVTHAATLGELPITSGAVSLGDALTGMEPTRPPSETIAPGS